MADTQKASGAVAGAPQVGKPRLTIKQLLFAVYNGETHYVALRSDDAVFASSRGTWVRLADVPGVNGAEDVL